MIPDFLRITLRHLWKNKTYSFLNIIGLAIGITCAGFIFLWVEDEVNMDSSYAKKDRLYKVLTNQTYEGKVRAFHSSPANLAAAVKAEIPGIVDACRVSQKTILFSRDEKSIFEKGLYTDAPFFKIFELQFIAGHAKNAFSDLHTVVITEQMAKRYFGSASQANGKMLKVDNDQDYLVTGVVKDPATNSTLQFGWMIPFEVYARNRDYLKRWGANSVQTYVELAPTADLNTVNKQLDGFIGSKDPQAGARPFLFSMNDWNLRANFEDGKQTGGRITYVRMFSVIAWIILLIACINFMNLATARSEKRAREVGVRKVMGAGRKMLMLQFIGEAIAMALLAVLIGVGILQLLLPAFNLLVGKQLRPGLNDPTHVLALLGIALLCGLVAGSYPAFYLSSFNPVAILKGVKQRTDRAGFIRKGLVVFQFTISIVLIISTIIIFQQIQYLRQRDIGYTSENLLITDLQGELSKNFAAIKQDLLNTGVVENLGLSSNEMLYVSDNTSGFSWQGKSPDSDILISHRSVSPEFMSTWGMKILAGRDFRENATADSLNVMITESLEKLMGNGTAIGKTISDDDKQYTVTGVIKDYVYGDMYGQKSDPVIFFCKPQLAKKVMIRLKAGLHPEAALTAIAAVMKKDNPAYPFVYRFVDEQLNAIFNGEILIGKLSKVFSLLAIVISCLGLFGLAAYTAERRVKEISIRKVLGASVASITQLLSKGFLRLIVLSAFIAFPIAWWAMSGWLQQYAYRITISGWIFVIAGLLAVVIALTTISFQAIKAALANPVKSLRSE